MLMLKRTVLGISALATSLCLAAPAQALTVALTPVYPGTVSGTANYTVNEKLKFKFTIAPLYKWVFTATGSGGTFPFPISFVAAGGPGTYTETFGPFPVTGTVNYSLVTSIPEPGVWMMLIAGFGMVGVSKRRRGAAVSA